MSDHMGGSSIQEATSGGFQTGKKRVPQSPDHMNVGAKRRGRGFSIEKQLQMAESHTLPTQSSDGSSSVLAGHGQRRRGRGPNVSTLLDKGKKVKSGPSQKLYQTPAISCVLNGADDTGVSQSNTDGSERSTTGVRNLLHVFNEADDNNSDEEQFDETGMPS
ncbi:hypothetical protein ACET3Z_009641 [Daucus carota]